MKILEYFGICFIFLYGVHCQDDDFSIFDSFRWNLNNIYNQFFGGDSSLEILNDQDETQASYNHKDVHVYTTESSSQNWSLDDINVKTITNAPSLDMAIEDKEAKNYSFVVPSIICFAKCVEKCLTVFKTNFELCKTACNEFDYSTLCSNDDKPCVEACGPEPVKNRMRNTTGIKISVETYSKSNKTIEFTWPSLALHSVYVVIISTPGDFQINEITVTNNYKLHDIGQCYDAEITVVAVSQTYVQAIGPMKFMDNDPACYKDVKNVTVPTVTLVKDSHLANITTEPSTTTETYIKAESLSNEKSGWLSLQSILYIVLLVISIVMFIFALIIMWCMMKKLGTLSKSNKGQSEP